MDVSVFTQAFGPMIPTSSEILCKDPPAVGSPLTTHSPREVPQRR